MTRGGRGRNCRPAGALRICDGKRCASFPNNRDRHGTVQQHTRFRSVAESGGFTAAARRLTKPVDPDGHPTYLKNHPAPRSPADLASHNCLRYAFYPFGDGWHFIDPAGKPVVAPVDGNLLTTSLDVLRETALAGEGLLFAGPFIIHKELEAGSLVPLLLDYRTVELSVAAVYPHRRHMAPKVRVFIDALVTLFSREQWFAADG